MLRATAVHGIKIYDLSQSKSAPSVVGGGATPDRGDGASRAGRRRSAEARRSVDLLQDFSFPTFSSRVRVTDDGQYVFCAGGYPPQIKCFDVSQVSLKFERHVVHDVVDLLPLSSDFSKLCVLGQDRSLSFHSRQGERASLRVPTQGRAMCYDPETCDLYVGCSEADVHRINLNDGVFRAPWTSSLEPGAGGINALAQAARAHRLVCVGGDDGRVLVWDPRSRTEVGALALPPLSSSSRAGRGLLEARRACTALAFEPSSNGLALVVGTSDGECLAYDLRGARPISRKEHSYGLSILSFAFPTPGASLGGGEGRGERLVLSQDARQIKAWDLANASSPSVFNVEAPPGGGFRSMTLAPATKAGEGSSGLIMAAADQPHVATYFCPRLGPAPRWAGLLDSLTEELEEEDGTEGSLFDDWKFVTRALLHDLGLDRLLGTPSLRPWMHGFLIEARLFSQLASVSNPDEYREWRRRQVSERRRARTREEAVLRGPPVKVNRALAERASTLLADERFRGLFEDPEFEVDEQAPEYKRIFTSKSRRSGAAGKGGAAGSAMEEEEDEEEEEEKDDAVEEEGDHDRDAVASAATARSVPAPVVVSVVRAPSRRSFLDATGNEDQDDDDDRSAQLLTGSAPLGQRLARERRRAPVSSSSKVGDDGDDDVVIAGDTIVFRPTRGPPRRG